MPAGIISAIIRTDATPLFITRNIHSSTVNAVMARTSWPGLDRPPGVGSAATAMPTAAAKPSQIHLERVEVPRTGAATPVTIFIHDAASQGRDPRLPASLLEDELGGELELPGTEHGSRTAEARISRVHNAVLVMPRSGPNEVRRKVHAEDFVYVWPVEQIECFGKQMKPEPLSELEVSRQPQVY